MSDEDWMRRAIELAGRARRAGEVPVGAIATCNDEIIGSGFNRPISRRDPTAHAEICALREASRHLQNYRIPGVTLYVTLEPCMMCAGAMLHARIRRLVYGAADAKTGVIDSHLRAFNQITANHRVEVTGGVLSAECGALLSAFFKARRG